MLVDILVTLLIATLSGMGIGSGGLMVLYLTFVRHAPQLTAQGFNLLFFLFAAAASSLLREVTSPAQLSDALEPCLLHFWWTLSAHGERGFCL